MSRWSDLPEPPAPPEHRSRAALVVPFALAAALVVLGRSTLAIVVAVAATVVTALTFLAPAAAAVLARGLATVGRWVGHAVGFVLLALVDVLVFVPLALVARLVRRDPLERGHRPGDPTRWDDHGLRVGHRHLYAREVARVRSRSPVVRTVAAIPRVLGVLVLLVVGNYAVGWVWDEYVGSHDVPPDQVVVATTADLADSDAMADEPWAEDYWTEFGDLDHEFVPFLLSRVADVQGASISSEGGVRRSREPAGEDLPVVWFFGGGAAWGEGQRDEHTIPSEVVALAEAAGTPVRLVNYGQPGYTSWQSALLFEQELAVNPAPDLAVFYDGADDVAVQLEGASTRPTHYNAHGSDLALTGRDSASEQLEEYWNDYVDTSVVTRLVRNVTGVFGAQPAWAADDGLVERVTDLHGRSVALATDVATDHQIPVLFTWQAAQGVRGDGGAYREVAGAGSGPVDLSGALDDVEEPVFLDGVLTDERGAALVAEALWPLIEARLA